MTQAFTHMEWVRPIHQARSQETLERLLEAAEEVVSEKGFDNATVSEIVRRAKSSVGAMYARFNDKESLLVVLHERFCEQALATTEAVLDPQRWEGSSIADILATALPFMVHVYQQKRGLLRAFMMQSSDPQFTERASRVGREISAVLVKLLMSRRHEIRHPDPVLAVDFGLRATFDILDLTTFYGDVQRTQMKLTPDQLGEELVRMFTCYLGIETPAIWAAAEDHDTDAGEKYAADLDITEDLNGDES
ncbi:MAG: TetR/AcrR family transcriptional regulator [Pirellulales bacterium]